MEVIVWRKVVPTLVLLAVIGAGIYAYLRLGSEEDCKEWATTTLRKARISYAAVPPPREPFPSYLTAMYERPSFKIDGTLYVNPGGCKRALLPKQPAPRP